MLKNLGGKSEVATKRYDSLPEKSIKNIVKICCVFH